MARLPLSRATARPTAPHQPDGSARYAQRPAVHRALADRLDRLYVYPILASFYYSLTEYDIVSSPKFVGLENYRTLLFSDPLFYQAVGNTLFYAAIAIPLNLVVAC